jgi:hypothetical protein
MWKCAILLVVLSAPIGACVFEVRPACRDGGGCGVGEICIVRNGEETCRCGSAEVVGAPVCAAPQECVADARCNAPPVAVIGDGSTPINVGMRAPVATDGLSSWDPDGDSLDFSWALDGTCFTSIQSDSGPVLRFTTGDAGATCTVALTADDGIQQTTASATVSVLEIGSHVSSQAPCAISDGSPVAGKGTTDNPWCELTDGLATASQYGLTEVRVALGAYAAAGFEIPAGVTIRGGFSPGTDPWSHDEGARSTVTLDSVTDYDPRGISLVGEGAVLANIEVFRTARCSGDCAAVTVAGVSATISDCRIGGDDANGQRLSARDSTAVALSVRGARDGAVVTIEGTTVLVPAEGAVAYGVELDGDGHELHAVLADVQVDGSGTAMLRLGPYEEVAGIRTFGLASFDASNVTSVLGEVIADRGFAIADGRLGVDDCSGPRTCGASSDWSLAEVSASTDGLGHVQTAAGIALFGTDAASITAGSDPYRLLLSGSGSNRGVGLWTVDSTGLLLDGLNDQQASAKGYVDLASQSVQPGPPVAAGILDGVPPDWAGSSLEVPSGSTAMAIGRLRTMGGISDPNGVGSNEVMAGAWLLGTDGASLDAVTFESDGAGGIERAFGLWTLATRDVVVTDSVFGKPGAAMRGGDGVVACLADGLFNARGIHDPSLGSVRLRLLGSVADTYLDLWNGGLVGSAVAGVLLVGSDNARIGSLAPDELNVLAVKPEGSSGLQQIWTIATSYTRIIGNVIGPRRPARLDYSGSPRLAGIRDGDATIANQATAHMASRDLVIDANWIYGGYGNNYESMVGVWLDHDLHGTSGSIRIENNVVLGYAAKSVTGIAASNAAVDMVNNTIQGVWCPPSDWGIVCGTPELAVGIEVTGGLERDVNVANNILVGGQAARTILVQDVDGVFAAADDLTPSLIAFAHNLLVPDADVGNVGHVYYCGQDTSGNEACAGEATILAVLDDLEVDLGDDFLSYWNGVGLCGDGVHLSAPANVDGLASASYRPLHDIDGWAREDPHDIGADEAGSGTLVCPPAP